MLGHQHGIARTLALAEGSFLGLGVVGVFSADVIVKHFAQNLFTFEGVSCEMELDGAANRAGTIKEVIFWLGLYDQFCFVHATIMPQSGCWSETIARNTTVGTDEQSRHLAVRTRNHNHVTVRIT